MYNADISASVLDVSTRSVSRLPFAANRRLIRLKMLSYEKQLELKRNTVVEAYRNYSGS